jgi:hypothetical protein
VKPSLGAVVDMNSEWDNEPLPTDPAELQAWREKEAKSYRHHLQVLLQRFRTLITTNEEIQARWQDPQIYHYASHRKRTLIYIDMLANPDAFTEAIRSKYCQLFEQVQEVLKRGSQYDDSYPPELDDDY